MTEDQIAELVRHALDGNGLYRWTFRWEDTLPSTLGKLAGHTDWDTRIIRFARDAVLNYTDDQVWALIEHELAHALTPEERFHGRKFDHKLRELRSGCVT
jgi:Zn-dependent membrane protease YugP